MVKSDVGIKDDKRSGRKEEGLHSSHAKCCTKAHMEALARRRARKRVNILQNSQRQRSLSFGVPLSDIDVQPSSARGAKPEPEPKKKSRWIKEVTDLFFPPVCPSPRGDYSECPTPQRPKLPYSPPRLLDSSPEPEPEPEKESRWWISEVPNIFYPPVCPSPRGDYSECPTPQSPELPPTTIGLLS